MSEKGQSLPKGDVRVTSVYPLISATISRRGERTRRAITELMGRNTIGETPNLAFPGAPAREQVCSRQSVTRR